MSSIIGNQSSDSSVYGAWNPSNSGGGGNGSLTNPLTSNLDLGGNQLINSANVITVPISSDLNMHNNSVLGIENLAFHNTGTLSVNEAGQLLFNSSPVSSGGGGSSVENPMTTNLNANSYDITNVGGILIKDAINQLNSYWITTENGGLLTSSTTDAEDVKLYISINEGGNTKGYYTDFRGFPITNLGDVTFSNGGSMVSSNGSFVFDRPINFGNNLLTTAQSISFGVSNSTSINLNDGVLQVNDDPIVTSGNISTYIDSAVSGLGYFKPGSTALNMGNYQVNNALFYGLYNSSNPALQHSIAVSGGKIQIDGYDALNSQNCGSYVGFSSGGAVGTINMNNHDLQGLDTLTFNNSKVLTTNGSNELTYDGSPVLTQANSGLAVINPWYSFQGKANSTTPLALYITISGSDSSYYFCGNAIGLLSGVSFSCFIYPDGNGGLTVTTPNVVTLADIDGDLFQDLTVTATTSQITLTLESQQVAPLYDSITVMYQIIQNDFQA